MKKIFPLLFVMLLGLSACATNSIAPQAPKIKVSSVKPSKLGLTGQSFVFTLSAENPNLFSLPIAATDFTARFNGQDVAEGTTDTKVVLPANGAADIVVTVDTNLMSSMQGMWKQLATGKLDFSYELEGAMKVDYGIAPFSVPYSVKGNLLDKVKLFGKK